VLAQGALIGGGVGALLAVLRRPADGQDEPDRVVRIAKSVAEGALAGAAVGLAFDARMRRAAASLLIANAPLVIDTVADLAQRYEPEIERFAEVARERAGDVFEAARSRALELRAS
jgi:hypothetical protein